MNILIVDSAPTPDSKQRQAMMRHFGRATENNVRHANGILESAWLLCQFAPDLVVLGRAGAQIDRLIALQRQRNPRLATLRLDGPWSTP